MIMVKNAKKKNRISDFILLLLHDISYIMYSRLYEPQGAYT